MSVGNTVQVRLNGTDREVEDGITVLDLLTSLGLQPGMVVVELNRDILARDAYGDRRIHEGDRIELVHFVGGG